MELEAFRTLAKKVGARAGEVPAAQARMAAAGRAAGIPMASHDDDTIATRDGFRAEGARIFAFPVAEEVGVAARAGGVFVASGPPNVVSAPFPPLTQQETTKVWSRVAHDTHKNK